ncbi:hypothetical protein Tco_1064618 [Tanacetum coccineum]
MGEPLSPDRVFNFPMDKPESHPAYDFFAPRPLPGYAGKPNNNNNGWIEADVPLLGELRAEVDELMVGPVVDEIVEPIVEMEEQVITPAIDVKEDIAMLFGDDEEVWEVNKEWLMAPVTPPPMPVVPPPSTYEVGGPSTATTEGQSFTLLAPGFLVPSLVSDAEVADGITIREIGLRVSTVEGQVQVMASQMVEAVGRVEQVGTQVEQGQKIATQRDEAIAGLIQPVQTLQDAIQQRDVQIQQLQTMVSEMSSRKSTLM